MRARRLGHIFIGDEQKEGRLQQKGRAYYRIEDEDTLIKNTTGTTTGRGFTGTKVEQSAVN